MIDDFVFYVAAGHAAHPIADWATDFALTYGPGIALCTAIYTIWSITARIYDRLRDATHHIDHLLAPATPVDDQPGTDDDLLNHCQTARKAQPATRKEKP